MSEVNKEEMFPSNSIIKREEPKKQIRQVTTGKVVEKKPGLGRKMADTFLGDDVENVKSYLIMDVVVPAIKDTIVDMVCSGVEMIFGVGRRGGRPSSRTNYTNYSSFSYKAQERDRRDYRRESSRNRYDPNEIIVETRQEAEDVIFQLAELCENYGMARVADLYELVGKTGDFQSQKWGWESVAHAKAIRIRGGGYLIDLPKPIYLE